MPDDVGFLALSLYPGDEIILIQGRIRITLKTVKGKKSTLVIAAPKEIDISLKKKTKENSRRGV